MLTNNIVSFEQLAPDISDLILYNYFSILFSSNKHSTFFSNMKTVKSILIKYFDI